MPTVARDQAGGVLCCVHVPRLGLRPHLPPLLHSAERPADLIRPPTGGLGPRRSCPCGCERRRQPAPKGVRKPALAQRSVSCGARWPTGVNRPSSTARPFPVRLVRRPCMDACQPVGELRVARIEPGARRRRLQREAHLDVGGAEELAGEPGADASSASMKSSCCARFGAMKLEVTLSAMALTTGRRRTAPARCAPCRTPASSAAAASRCLRRSAASR
jgi:hypothetical protein